MLPFVGGIAVGLGAGAIFATLLAAIEVHTRFPRVSAPDWAIPTIISVVALASGVAFVVLVAAARHERPLWWRTLVIGASLPVAGLVGLELAIRLEPLGTSRPDLTLPVFRIAFVSASVLVAFVCTWVATALFRVPASIRHALVVAAITGGTYLLLALILDPIPGFHVGGGDRAMPKVALLCNLIAGGTGGSLAFRILTRDWSMRKANHTTLA